MYTRINQRLQSYNLAIGEFPEVVADSIRRSVLDNSTVDDSADLLKEIRNSLQTEALKALWDSTGQSRTSSRRFREGLIKDVFAASACERVDLDTIRVAFEDGSSETVTAEEGNANTISLSSRCVLEYYLYLHGYRKVRDADGRSCAYASQGEILDPESLPNRLAGTVNGGESNDESRPKWLPDATGMGLGYAVEYQSPAPRYWPPETGKKK